MKEFQQFLTNNNGKLFNIHNLSLATYIMPDFIVLKVSEYLHK